VRVLRVGYDAFMPKQDDEPEVDHNYELGMKIKRLVEEGKIRLGGFDKNCKLEIEHLSKENK
jgi:hypothetical protein